jgi:hypothetical protein
LAAKILFDDPMGKEPAMNTIVASVLKHEAAKARAGSGAFKTIAIFCGVGLLVSICLVSIGLDIGAGYF